MGDRTGFARGRVNPVIYFKDRKGTCILAPEQIGQGLALAHQIYEQRYKHEGWEWCEADTWDRVVALQEKLIEQEKDSAESTRERAMFNYDAAKAKTAASLRTRMASGDCTPYERDFIQLWFQLSPEKRKKYEQRFHEHQSYLWSVEMDAGTKVEDRMKAEPGDTWKS
jgi:hypothetical protein